MTGLSGWQKQNGPRNMADGARFICLGRTYQKKS